MPLRETYESAAIHDRWEAVYRGHPLLDRLNDRILDRILAWVQAAPDALFLDAGCGTADHAIRLARRGYRCVAVDLSENVLRRAADNVARAGLSSRVTLACQPLERLSFADAVFDAVHCRGVLMHIPDWERAAAELCRVVKPGGKIVILEANHRALEAALVRFFRRFGRSESRMQWTPGGVEFWSEEDNRPFVRRVANVSSLRGQLEHCSARVNRQFATEFWDANLFPEGWLRNLAIRFNLLWFAVRGPWILSSGVAVLGVKATGLRSPGTT